MTQLRKHRDAISNYFDEIERGIGKRESTFTDIDAVTHDGDTGRLLFREFKEQDEPLSMAQARVLRQLSFLPRCTVWLCRRRSDGQIGWSGGPGCREIALTVERYQQLLREWWRGEDTMRPYFVTEETLEWGREIGRGAFGIVYPEDKVHHDPE